MPTAPTADDLKAADSVVANFKEYKPDYYDNADEKPATGENNKINAVTLRGATYDDPRWDALLDELTEKEMTELIYSGNQGTIPVKSIGLPMSNATDGQKEIKLEAPTSGYTNMNGSVTLSSDDPSVLEDFDATSFTVNVNTGAIEQ